MTDVAVFTCGACPFDGDAPFRYHGTLAETVVWDCPDCGEENACEMETEDPDRFRDWCD